MKIENFFHPSIKVSDDFCVITKNLNFLDQTLDKSFPLKISSNKLLSDKEEALEGGD